MAARDGRKRMLLAGALLGVCVAVLLIWGSRGGVEKKRKTRPPRDPYGGVPQYSVTVGETMKEGNSKKRPLRTSKPRLADAKAVVAVENAACLATRFPRVRKDAPSVSLDQLLGGKPLPQPSEVRLALHSNGENHVVIGEPHPGARSDDAASMPFLVHIHRRVGDSPGRLEWIATRPARTLEEAYAAFPTSTEAQLQWEELSYGPIGHRRATLTTRNGRLWAVKFSPSDGTACDTEGRRLVCRCEK